jgi:SurA N-terminal domain
VLRRLIKASAVVIGVGLVVAGCAVTPVKLGSAAIVGNQRISVSTLNSQVMNLSRAAKQYPGVVTLTAAEQTQAALTWLIRYQVNEKLASQQGITISPAQAAAALQSAYENAKAAAEEQGVTNATLALILAASGIPPDTSAELGRYEAIADQYMKNVNGGTAPATGSAAATAAGNKLTDAECLAAKALDIQVNPQYGQLDFSQLQVVPAPPAVSRTQGPVTSPSPVATAPAC